MAALYRSESDWQRWVFRIFVLAEIFLVSLLVVLGRDPDYEDQQYTELAHALLEGQVYLDIEVPTEIINAENPYENTWFEGYDRAYYDGKMYVYFGIIPCLVFYLLPIAFGIAVPEFIVQGIICILLCIGMYLLIRRTACIWLDGKAPFWSVVFGYLCVMNTTYILWCANTSRVYEISCLSALVCVVYGLWCYMVCFQRNQVGERFNGWLLAGSICMAMTIECRPNMILWCLMGIPLLWDAVICRFWANKDSWRKAGIALFPYLVIGIGAMYYDYIRFGDPFQFGQIYVLTGFDISETVTYKRILPGLRYYYLMLPKWSHKFPFLLERYPSEDFLTPNFRYFCGMDVNLYMWLLLFFIPTWKKMRDQCRKLWEVCIWLIGISFMQSLADIYYGGLFHRYFMDFAWGYALAAYLIIGFFLYGLKETGLKTGLLGILFILLIVNIDFHLFLGFRNEGGFYYMLIRIQWVLNKLSSHISFIRGWDVLYFETG